MTSLPWYDLAALLGVGLLAGFANVVGGGGSLLTLPALLFVGLPSVEANATNRIGLILQNVAATATFRRGGRLPTRLAVRLALVAAPGAVLGARLALDVDDTWFRRILAVVMLAVVYVTLRGTGRSAPDQAAESPPHPRALAISFFFMGVYAGFLQAGIGFLLIAALTRLGGLDLVRTNAVKVAVVLVLQILALIVFQVAAGVDWWAGLALGCGSMLGGSLSAHWQMRQGVVWVRRLLVVLVILVALRLLQESL